MAGLAGQEVGEAFSKETLPRRRHLTRCLRPMSHQICSGTSSSSFSHLSWRSLEAAVIRLEVALLFIVAELQGLAGAD